MKRFISVFFLLFGFGSLNAQALYELPGGTDSRLSSFENLNGVKGAGGKSNKTAKGNAFEMVQPGETKTLLDIDGEGTITRIWMTVNANPIMLRSLRLEMFWEHATKPAVDVPMGDFFLHNLGKNIPFQTALFTSAEGRSFNCYVAMPFKKHARIVLKNEGKEAAKLFFDISFLMQKLPANIGYFHSYWTRQNKGPLGKDVEVLPKIKGRGRFLGLSVALITDSVYDKTWWGEGEVKMFKEDDSIYPSYVGSGAEDYIGSAWGLGSFNHMYQGCTVASEINHEFEFYRFHIPDPIYFKKEIRITWQQIGGGDYKIVKALFEKGVPLQPVSVDGKEFTRLMDMNPAPKITGLNFPEGWVNFYRVDDYAVTSYFYLDDPTTGLPPLTAVSNRIRGLK
jgi:hypothetical protein